MPVGRFWRDEAAQEVAASGSAEGGTAKVDMLRAVLMVPKCLQRAALAAAYLPL